jgi:UDP-N-acetyl-D-glucosamine dehydrogenase
VLDAEIVRMSSAEAAEFSKLADTTYRDVNIALANEFARYASRVGVDIGEVIAAANSQPYSHIHQPGIGVGGHCIPVYPHFLLSRAPEMELVDLSRRVNDGQVGLAVRAIQEELGGLEGVRVLVLGLTYRDGVKELAYSRALPLIEQLRLRGAVVAASDPLLSEADIAGLGAIPYRWGEPSDAQAIVTQTADPAWRTLDIQRFPDLQLVFDGRNSLGDLTLPEHVAFLGVGVPGAGRGLVGASTRG